MSSEYTYQCNLGRCKTTEKWVCADPNARTSANWVVVKQLSSSELLVYYARSSANWVGVKPQFLFRFSVGNARSSANSVVVKL